MHEIPAEALIDDFDLMLREHWRYEWSGCSRGVVSCSGAFTWAYRQHGLEIYQGSNRIARRYVEELIPIDRAKAEGLIVPGMAAFKVRKPGASLYALPDAYKPGGAYYNGDLLDYYHIGLVDRDVGFVLNAQSAKTGFVRSRIGENWSHVARLKAVDYGEDGQAMAGTDDAKEEGHMQARVIGGRLRLRKSASISADVVLSIDNGSTVQVVDLVGDGWAKVIADGRQGYVMAKYLDAGDGAAQETSPREEAKAAAVTVQMSEGCAREMLDALARALGRA